MTAHPLRDVRAVFPPSGARRIPPRHAAAWARIDGAWHEAEVVAWLQSGRSAGPLWAVLLRWTPPGESEPITAAYEYGDGAVRARVAHLPPDRWRDWCTPEEARPFQYGPRGRRLRLGHIGPYLPCPGCGAPVEQVADGSAHGEMTFLPCGQRLTIRASVAAPVGPGVQD
jgi:hypothetical protein